MSVVEGGNHNLFNINIIDLRLPNDNLICENWAHDRVHFD